MLKIFQNDCIAYLLVLLFKCFASFLDCFRYLCMSQPLQTTKPQANKYDITINIHISYKTKEMGR